jgi:hypothetical protein
MCERLASGYTLTPKVDEIHSSRQKEADMQTVTNDPARFIRDCVRCSLRYDWRRSASASLKMTYCGSLCERADLGFTIEALLRTERTDRRTPLDLAA